VWGSTPLMNNTLQKKYPALAQKLNLPEIWIKHECLNESGSHKIRLLSYLFEKYISQGEKNFVISSSGNAAIAACYYLKKINNPQINLMVFVPSDMDSKKWKRLQLAQDNSPRIKIKKTKKAKQKAFQFSKETEAIFLRGSTELQAEQAYISLGDEIKQIPNLQAIFIPTSSGITSLGIFESFVGTNKNIEIHIVQTEKIHPLAQNFDREFKLKNKSLAKAIVDKTAKRKTDVIRAVQESAGWAWVISDKELKRARKIIEINTDIAKISYDSLLSIAGLLKAQKNNWKFNKTVCCLFTGR